MTCHVSGTSRLDSAANAWLPGAGCAKGVAVQLREVKLRLQVVRRQCRERASQAVP